MKFLKNNIKLIIGLIVEAILAGGIVYATTTNAKDVDYTTNKNGEISNVADALNDLYTKSNRQISFGAAQYSNNNSDILASKSTTVTLSKGKYIIEVLNTVGSLSEAQENTASDKTILISCPTETFTKISGRAYTYAASGICYQGTRTYAVCQSTIYYADITEDNSVVHYDTSGGTANSLISNIRALHAIPIN